MSGYSNPSARRSAAEKRRANRSEDLAWMAEHGETLYGAAARLGLSWKSLDHWCTLYDRDVRERLRRNEERVA